MKRTAVILLILLLALSMAITAEAETYTQPDRQIIFEESRVIAGVRASITQKPRIERLTETAPEETKLVWQSSNPAVATVNTWGKISTLTPGGTLITAQAEDDPGILASYELYVVWPVEKMMPENPEITLALDQSGSMDETDLFYTFQPSDAWIGGVRWSSSKETIAAVNETGHVKAVSPGDAVIVAEAVMPQGCPRAVKSSYHIHVVRKADTLTLSENSIELKRGKTYSLKAEISPSDAADRKLVWTSSDPDIAGVVNGWINGVNSGTCEILCATADGRLKASCWVTVIWPTRDVKLSVNKASLSPGEQLKLEAKVNPADADNTGLVWSSSNSQIASVNSKGTVTAGLGGECVITCTPEDGAGTGDECTIIVPPFSIAEKEWTVDQTTGITIPVQWHSYEQIALELKTKTTCFRATWNMENNISIQPLKPGRGTLTVQPANSPEDRIELLINITENAVTNPEDYPRLTFNSLLNKEPEIGTKGKILGRVLQRIEQQDQVIILIGTSGENWDSEVFWVEHGSGDPVTKATEGNLVIVCGTYEGVYTYKNAAGREISVPALKARQITLQ